MDHNVSQIAALVCLAARQFSQWSTDEHISRQQFILLMTLDTQRRMTVSDLASRLNLSPSATTIAIGRLVKSGYILRTRDENDRRLVWVEATQKATELVTRLGRQRNRLLTAMLANLSPEEIEQFTGLLRKMVSQLSHPAEDEEKEGSCTKQ